MSNVNLTVADLQKFLTTFDPEDGVLVANVGALDGFKGQKFYNIVGMNGTTMQLLDGDGIIQKKCLVIISECH